PPLFHKPQSATQIYSLSLHDALPISRTFDVHRQRLAHVGHGGQRGDEQGAGDRQVLAADVLALVVEAVLAGDERHAEADRGKDRDRKSTRLNSSHVAISYAVFCLKKK